MCKNSYNVYEAGDTDGRNTHLDFYNQNLILTWSRFTRLVHNEWKKNKAILNYRFCSLFYGFRKEPNSYMNSIRIRIAERMRK